MSVRTLCVTAAVILAALPLLPPAASLSMSSWDDESRLTVQLPDHVTLGERFQGTITITSLTSGATSPSVVVDVPTDRLFRFSAESTLGSECEKLAEGSFRCIPPVMKNFSGRWWSTMWVRGTALAADTSESFAMRVALGSGAVATAVVPVADTADLIVHDVPDRGMKATWRVTAQNAFSYTPYLLDDFLVTNVGPRAMTTRVYAVVYPGQTSAPQTNAYEWGHARILSPNAPCGETTTRGGATVHYCDIDIRPGETVTVPYNATLPTPEVAHTVVAMAWPAASPLPLFTPRDMLVAAIPGLEQFPKDNILAIPAMYSIRGPSPTLDLRYTPPPTPTEGWEMGVSVMVQNLGGPAAGATLDFDVTNGLGLRPDDPTRCRAEGGHATCDLGAFPAGLQVLTFYVKLSTKDMELTALLTTTPEPYAAGGEPVPAQAWAYRHLVQEPPPDISLAVEGPLTPTSGTAEPYLFTVENKGLGGLKAPLVVTLRSGAPILGVDPLCTPVSSNEARCTLTTLAPGASRALSMVVRPSVTLTNVFTVSGVTSTGATASLQATVQFPRADLVLTQLALSDDTPAVGSAVKVTISVRNDGPSAMSSTYVLATLPEGLTFPDTSQGPCVKFGSQIRCSMGHISSGATVTQAVDVQATKAGTYETLATAHPMAPLNLDPNTANNGRTVGVTISA